MADNRMVFIGEKESFVLRVLKEKVQKEGVECIFVPWYVDDINTNITNVALYALFMDDGERPREEVLHFLVDILEEKNLQMVVAGAEHDIQHICEHVPNNLIYKTFPRPIDNMEFSRQCADYIAKVAKGEFRKSILIVDDDPQYLTMIREWLKGSYKVTMANSGLQALKLLGRNKVDLILLDHEMPVTSGPQVLEMLRSEEDTRSIPVMFLTGKGDKDSVMAVAALRPEGYFLKGIQKEDLLEKLQEYFTLHK